MQIRVKSPEGPNLWIPLPTGLIFNRLTAFFAARSAAEMGLRLSPGQMARLFTALKRYKHLHPDWVLVEVDSTEGDHVRVKL